MCARGAGQRDVLRDGLPGQRGPRPPPEARAGCGPGREGRPGGQPVRESLEIYPPCSRGRTILQEAACIKISRPVDWSVTVICGSSPEVMGSNWGRARRLDRLLHGTGGGRAAGKIY